MAHPKKIDFYQWMKILFHFLSFIFLIYLAFSIKSLSIFSKLILIIIAFVHGYDSWWFIYKYTPEQIYAPI
jgi:hypothetical protein